MADEILQISGRLRESNKGKGNGSLKHTRVGTARGGPSAESEGRACTQKTALAHKSYTRGTPAPSGAPPN